MTVAVLALPQCRRPARVRTGGPAKADDGRTSVSGKAQSQRRQPLGYPKRITLDLTVDDHHALLGARCADRVPMSDRLRALISLWRQDPALAKAVSTRAQKLPLAANPGPASAPSPEPPTQALGPQASLAS